MPRLQQGIYISYDRGSLLPPPFPPNRSYGRSPIKPLNCCNSFATSTAFAAVAAVAPNFNRRHPRWCKGMDATWNISRSDHFLQPSLLTPSNGTDWLNNINQLAAGTNDTLPDCWEGRVVRMRRDTHREGEREREGARMEAVVVRPTKRISNIGTIGTNNCPGCVDWLPGSSGSCAGKWSRFSFFSSLSLSLSSVPCGHVPPPPLQKR